MFPSPTQLRLVAAQAAADAAHRAGMAARKAVLMAGAGLALCVGFGFLTAALWIFLATVQDHLFAALVIGLIYVGAGMILIAVAAKGRPQPIPHAAPRPEFTSARSHAADPLHDARVAAEGPAAPPRGEFPPLMEAFIFGLNTAAKVRRRKSRL